jgi:hypothetical protein
MRIHLEKFIFSLIALISISLHMDNAGDTMYENLEPFTSSFIFDFFMNQKVSSKKRQDPTLVI